MMKYRPWLAIFAVIISLLYTPLLLAAATELSAGLATEQDFIASPAVESGATADKKAPGKNYYSPINKSTETGSNATSGAKPVGSAVVNANPATVVFGLLFVVGLIIALAWFMRRFSGLSMIAGQSMKVVSALSVGTREKVVLIDVGGEQILIGVAPGRVSHLQSFSQPVVEQATAAPIDFSSTIKKILQQDKASNGASKT
ncbi:MAG: flagellar protein FliO/FliZ [Oceanicoccus sp.]|jgi:flagellar protein FliO/FliZ